MGKLKRYFFLILVCVTALYSCRKDGPGESAQPQVSVGSSGGVYIIDEGNFGSGNAMVSYYNIAGGTSIEDLYKPANGVRLGDVCQSMCLFNKMAYLVVNNSGKVVVVNSVTFVATATITGFTSPRYFLPVSNSKAYVTDLYANAISVVNLSTNTITGKIPCKGWTEELALAYGKAFVTDEGQNKVYVINTSTDMMEDSIPVRDSANYIVEDKNGKFWVMCAGAPSGNIYAALYRINPLTDQVEQSFQFPNRTDNPGRLHINGSNDTLYFLNKNAYQMSISAPGLPAGPFVTAGTRNFYGVGVDPNTGTVYIADAIDYVQRGKVYRYQPNGILINSFLAGIIPGEFYFN